MAACADSRQFIGGTVPREIIDPLDVVAVYTYRDSVPAAGDQGVGVSIDIEHSPCKGGYSSEVVEVTTMGKWRISKGLRKIPMLTTYLLLVVSIAALGLVSGGLESSSQNEQEGSSSLIVTLSYPDNKVACVETRFTAEGEVESQQIKTTTVPRGPSWISIHPLDGSISYVVSWDARALTVIDNEQCVGVRALTFGGNLYAGAFRPDGAAFYAIDAENKRIIALDTSDPTNPQFIAFIALPGASSPRGLAFHPSGLAHVSDTDKDTLYVLDAINHQLVGTFHTGGRCSAYVKVSNNGEWVYIADRCLSRVYALETATGVITPIQLSGDSGAWFIVFLLNDRFALVSQTDPRRQLSSGQLSVIDVAQKREIQTIDVSGFATVTQASSALSATSVIGGFQPAGLAVIELSEEELERLTGVVVFPNRHGDPLELLILTRDPTLGALDIRDEVVFMDSPIGRPYQGEASSKSGGR